MSKHTEGPWTFHPRIASSRDAILDAQMRTVGFAMNLENPDGGFAPKEEVRANGVLMAAAPDLLRELKRMLEAEKDGDEFEERYADALAAVRKAEGGVS